MANTGPVPQPGILEINAYVPGESAVPGGVTPIKLSSNESPLGPSAKAVAAYKAEAGELHRYPDGAASALRNAIARKYGLDAGRIVCGCGSDELINLLAHAYVGPGDEAIYTEHGFLMYKIATQSSGGTPVMVREKAYRTDVDAILARAGPKTKVVFLANPNNPTGTYIPHDEVRRLHKGLPGSTLLVLDAAYSEYVRRNDYEAGLELVATTENTVMLRTFSKIYGLAGLRVGYGLAPAPIVTAIAKVRRAFDITTPAQEAALASLDSAQELERRRRLNAEGRVQLEGILRDHGLEPLGPAVANFLFVEVGDDSRPFFEQLLREGVIVRPTHGFGAPGAVRVTVGTPEEHDLLAAALERVLPRATA
jgi:histidinol-phosphate aminotransferase